MIPTSQFLPAAQHLSAIPILMLMQNLSEMLPSIKPSGRRIGKRRSEMSQR